MDKTSWSSNTGLFPSLFPLSILGTFTWVRRHFATILIGEKFTAAFSFILRTAALSQNNSEKSTLRRWMLIGLPPFLSWWTGFYFVQSNLHPKSYLVWGMLIVGWHYDSFSSPFLLPSTVKYARTVSWQK